MYQFARVLTLRGDQRQTGAWAIQITEKAKELSGLDISLWTSIFGYPVGTIGWSSIVEGRAHLAQATAALAADNEYLDLVMEAADWVVDPAEDIFRRFVHGGPAEDRPPVGAVASVTEGVATGGKMADAIAWAVNMAEHATNVAGSQVALLVNAAGTFGEMAFISVYPDHAAADAAAEAVQADAGYLDKLSGAAGLFVEGSARQRLLQRLA